MICSKLQRVTPVTLAENQQVQSEQIVIGICDYIPVNLKNVSNLNIWIQGEVEKIFNTVLWNQFYTKTLLKECYYQILQSFVSTDSNQPNNLVAGVYLRFMDKIYKLNQIMDWKSQVRTQCLAICQDKGEMHIQSFNNQAKSRKINLYFGIYASNIPNLHFGLRIASVQQLNSHSQILSTLKKHPQSKKSLIGQSMIKSRCSNNKENHKSSKTSVKGNANSEPPTLKKESKKRDTPKSNKKQSVCIPNSSECKPSSVNILSKQTLPDPFRQSLLSNYQPCARTHNRQGVMSKIITSKEQTIIYLKEQLRKQDQSYAQAMREMHGEHQIEMEQVRSSVKDILNSYQSSQKSYLNENMYLKDRVKVLQDCLTAKDEQVSNYVKEFQTMTAKQRELQEEVARMSRANSQLRAYWQQTQRNLKQQGILQREQIGRLKLDCQNYRSRYGQMVSTMKTFIDANDKH